MQTNQKILGQYMTPPVLSSLVASELGQCDVAIDFAVGDGALLSAVSSLSSGQTRLIGFDIDAQMSIAAKSALKNSVIHHANGLLAKLQEKIGNRTLGIVGNPPFVPGSYDKSGWVQRAFPDLIGKQGVERAEIQFLARSLVVGKQHGARVVMVMPIGFADGDIYRNIRKSLMSHYHILRSIEVSGCAFDDTEARTVVLVIDTSAPPARSTEICDFDYINNRIVRVLKGKLQPGTRLDARYHRAAVSLGLLDAVVRLKDLQVSITRGLFSRKEAAQNSIEALHTTNLTQASTGVINVPSKIVADSSQKLVLAKEGDILLPRTGTRVKWKPVVIGSGQAPITDHVFRIRAPDVVREVVYKSFMHPLFETWLKGVSKGVCATVLTKRELLEMPVFAMAD